MDQLYRQKFFDPVYIKDLTQQYKRRAHEAIIILEQNSTTKKLKGIMVFNRKPNREWLSREDNSSPTA